MLYGVVCSSESVPAGSDPNDIDGDGVLNENDSDEDGIKDGEDNCPNIFNPDQKNTALGLCMAGKIHTIPSKFKIKREIDGKDTYVLVDEATFCSSLESSTVEGPCPKQLLSSPVNNICENGKISLVGWCKQWYKATLGDACDTDDDADGIPDQYEDGAPNP